MRTKKKQHNRTCVYLCVCVRILTAVAKLLDHFFEYQVSTHQLESQQEYVCVYVCVCVCVRAHVDAFV